MSKKTDVTQTHDVGSADAAMIIAYLEYVRHDVRALSPLGAHLLAMAIQQVVEDVEFSKAPEDRARLYT